MGSRQCRGSLLIPVRNRALQVSDRFGEWFQELGFPVNSFLGARIDVSYDD